jgi:hypothetical protein
MRQLASVVISKFTGAGSVRGIILEVRASLHGHEEFRVQTRPIHGPQSTPVRAHE